MTTIATPPAPLMLPPGLMPYRLTVDQYEAMAEAGILTEHDRLELIEGLLVKKMTKKPDHSAGSESSWRAIHRLLPAGWHVRIEKPVRITARDSMPEPDVSVARGDHNDYVQVDPGPADVALVVEVARSSIAADRALAKTYGGGGIPVYWIVNVADRQLEVYAHPVPGARIEGAYPDPTILPESATADLILAGQVVAQIPVADLLPRKPQ
jgi:Uma2 family endonuclease